MGDALSVPFIVSCEDVFSCLFGLFSKVLSTHKSMAMILKLSSIFGVELVATHPTAKTGKIFRK